MPPLGVVERGVTAVRRYFAALASAGGGRLEAALPFSRDTLRGVDEDLPAPRPVKSPILSSFPGNRSLELGGRFVS